MQAMHGVRPIDDLRLEGRCMCVCGYCVEVGDDDIAGGGCLSGSVRVD